MKKFIYFAQIEKSKDIGVYKKIIGVTDSASEIGYVAKSEIIESNGIKGALELLKVILKSEFDTCIIRSIGPLMIIITPAIIFKRALKKYIVIDVPTPISTSILESRSRARNKIKMFLFEMLIKISFPLSLIPANRIIQYSHESKWFQLGVKRKSILSANGIKTSNVSKRESIPELGNTLTFIGVANISNSHGYDRLINSISRYVMINNNEINIIFLVVGEGPELNYLKELTQSLKIEKQIIFTGNINGENLLNLYEKSHIAVGSLASHRKNLSISSELKLREYTATGIPFIYSSNDIDFDSNFKYGLKFAPDESLISIQSIIEWYKKLEFDAEKSQYMTNYAIKRLDFISKINEMIPTPSS